MRTGEGKMPRRVGAALIAAVALVGASCGDDADQDSAAGTTVAEEAATTAATTATTTATTTSTVPVGFPGDVESPEEDASYCEWAAHVVRLDNRFEDSTQDRAALVAYIALLETAYATLDEKAPAELREEYEVVIPVVERIYEIVREADYDQTVLDEEYGAEVAELQTDEYFEALTVVDAYHTTECQLDDPDGD